MASKKQCQAGFQRLRAADVMCTDVQSAHATTKGDVLASMMIEGFGSVPILDENRRLIGIVSEHDLLAALAEGRQLNMVSADSVMSREPYAVRPETDVLTLIHVLRASGLIRAPVVGAEGKLLGLVARRDILRAYLGEPGAAR